MKTSKENKARNSLDQMLAQCDLAAPVPEDMTAWLSAEPVGKEAGAKSFRDCNFSPLEVPHHG